MKKALLLLVSYAVVGGLGFGAGIYVLPILTAPAAPLQAALGAAEAAAVYEAKLRRDLEGSDFLHWGEGTVHIGPETIALVGRLAPGPNYRLYLSPEFVETEAAFLRLKGSMVQVGAVETFDNFIVPVPAEIDPSQFAAVVIWCESFEQFITAGSYR